MSYREIIIKETNTQSGELRLSVSRQVQRQVEKVGPLLFRPTGKFRKSVSVQYGLSIHGQGATVKEAVADFRKRWEFFCANRHDIMMGRIDLI